ncbi:MULTISPECIES: helix-turn-helix domain-containing protein [unclassified Clostridium]|uniref:helix-turn-helix domain-containing protein n=1 Tax=unclassified Clostridium TaxID=2614128 RepID=UPI00207B01C3|nr:MULTISPECIES: helix-turn-helix domain-containing protein [unclassified Clostridium]
MNDQLFCTGIYKEGYGIIPKSVMRSNLSCGAKVLYAYICSFTGAGNSAFPSLELMCNELGMSEKKIYKCRKELIDNNLIAIEKKRIGSKYTNNIYTIITNPISEKYIEPSRFECVQNEPSKNGHIQNEPVQNDHVQESEETSHSLEPSQNGHVQNEPCPKVGTISNRLINKKEKRKTEFDELIEEYTDNERLTDTLYEFIKMRKTIKAAITTTGLKRILNRLDKLASTDLNKISILDNSIMNSWKGIFPLSESSNCNVIPITTKSQKPVCEFEIDKSKLGDL